MKHDFYIPSRISAGKFNFLHAVKTLYCVFQFQVLIIKAPLTDCTVILTVPERHLNKNILCLMLMTLLLSSKRYLAPDH